ncbi:MAG: M48 family metallopeptidase, partial [Thioalkalispiraceae bacterium]
MVTSIFIAVLIAAFLVELWLDRRQLQTVKAHRNEVPETFRDHISLEAHQKAADYTLAKIRISGYQLFYSSLLLLLWTLGGGLQLVDDFWQSLDMDSLLTGCIVILSVLLLGGLLELPFSLYRTFKIEQKFGFNRTTPRIYVSDLLKQVALSIILGMPLLWVVLWLMEDVQPLWWLKVWAVWMGFNLFLVWAYPAFIAPVFNKFNPLDDESLKSRIESLLKRCGFTSNGIFVMDGSTRSSHGNAYFSGMGQNKRIVFFDTLLESLNEDEVEAVLAHELGHFKHHHVKKRIASMALFSLAGLAVLAWLLEQPSFYTGLGVTEPANHMALLLFMMVSPLFSFFLQPLLSSLSRKHEFEADDYAVKQSSANTLIQALVKMYRDNASTLTP